jgi:hypothetical protein
MANVKQKSVSVLESRTCSAPQQAGDFAPQQAGDFAPQQAGDFAPNKPGTSEHPLLIAQRVNRVQAGCSHSRVDAKK